jgi:Tfp pilus assembly protein FimT
MRSDRGITLAELMVTMGLTTILGTMAVLFFVVANRTGNRTILTNQNTGDARVTLDEWTSMLRVAGWLDPSTKVDRFEEITSTKIVFYANLKNRSTSSTYTATGPTTKIALVLRVSKASTGQGQLVEIRFASDNTTVASSRQLAVLAGPTSGAPIFQPYSRSGSAIDLTQLGCMSGTTAKAGLCLQSAPSGAGMQDPTTGSANLSVSAGPLKGNPAKNVDKVLQLVGSVGISFTVADSSGTAQTSYTSLASVSSGYPS